MKRTQLGPGAKSLARGSTFNATPAPRKRRPISPASPEQRAKVRNTGSIVSGDTPCDPAHLWPRGRGGCDHPDCVIPLTRAEHRQFDQGELDILPDLIARGCWAELAHMIAEHHVDPIALLHRLTGDRYYPEEN